VKPRAPSDLASGPSGVVSPGPRLYLLSRPALDRREIARFSRDEGLGWKQTRGAAEAERLIEFAGRICYMSFGKLQSRKSNRDYIRRLIDQEHESVLEHASWTFLLTGVSRAFTHQMVRHRVGFSFSQLSQQYHDEATAKFVMPAELKGESPAESAGAAAEVRGLWLRIIEELQRDYQSITDELESEYLRSHPTHKAGKRLPKEVLRSIRSVARSLLPNATGTKLVFSANGRSLRHFLDLRGAILGDLEMRAVSALIYTRLLREAPALLCDFEMIVHEDGYPLIRRKRVTY